MIYRQKADSWPTFSLQKVLVYLKLLLRRSSSSKVTEFGTYRKLICDFLLVINTNLAFVSHRSKLLYSATTFVFNSPDGGVPLGRST